nr:hypothetical protein [Clostridium butyricum]
MAKRNSDKAAGNYENEEEKLEQEEKKWINKGKYIKSKFRRKC